MRRATISCPALWQSLHVSRINSSNPAGSLQEGLGQVERERGAVTVLPLFQVSPRDGGCLRRFRRSKHRLSKWRLRKKYVQRKAALAAQRELLYYAIKRKSAARSNTPARRSESGIVIPDRKLAERKVGERLVWRGSPRERSSRQSAIPICLRFLASSSSVQQRRMRKTLIFGPTDFLTMGLTRNATCEQWRTRHGARGAKGKRRGLCIHPSLPFWSR
jgi:hypothetical protein